MQLADLVLAVNQNSQAGVAAHAAVYKLIQIAAVCLHCSGGPHWKM